ncbi:hypothetical protein NCCP2716_23280 [Sporosarcina sp. NCCP-2716]|uniref:DUF669 domain-containing protein n=1 Tax=Sporosarcina sp. NCCP-2716 TaxID=2943679 RepID=UPI002040B8BE|nr:DUF669 domain-containing protein [Sporosarcina sp. NCCP-2716]GKV69830.1 hypothetical protein NCCP2716_23280 [Sporosarcina sp. NCCP-2716]
MSFFKMDEVEEVKGFQLPKPGKYEAVIINAVAKKTQAGKDMLVADFEIRSDVPQESQGAKVLYNNFTFEHPTARGIAKSLCVAAGYPPNHNFSSCEEMANGLINRNLEIGVKHEKGNDGNVYAKSSYYNPSTANPPAQPSQSFEVNDDDLPF